MQLYCIVLSYWPLSKAKADADTEIPEAFLLDTAISESLIQFIYISNSDNIIIDDLVHPHIKSDAVVQQLFIIFANQMHFKMCLMKGLDLKRT